MPNTTDTQTSQGPPALTDRFRAQEAKNGQVVIYDTKRSDAWIRSDYSVAVPNGKR